MLAVVGLYLAVAIWLVVKSPGWWRVVALLAVVLIPTADALWGRYVTLPRLCRDAGLKVYAKASKDGGLMLSTADDYWLTKYGFPFVEGVDGAGRIYRRSLRDGIPVLEENVSPKSKYLSQSARLTPSPTFVGTAYRVEDRSSGALLGELVTYAYLGGWAERFLGSFTGSGPGYAGGCDVERFTRERLLSSVFDLGG
jgi:hypothetical protein